MSLTMLPPGRQRTGGRPDPAEVITVTFGGRTFRAGRRTAAHLDFTFEAFERELPHLRLEVAQACYNAGYKPSAGTHDGDGVPDFYVTRADGSAASEDDYWAAQWLLRCLGWAIWFRHTGTWAARSGWHLHGISLGCPGPVGEFVPGQVDDYHRRAYGLKGQHDSGADPSRFPKDIDATYFDYRAWLASQQKEHDMTPQESQKLDGVARDVKLIKTGLGKLETHLQEVEDSVLQGRRVANERFRAISKNVVQVVLDGKAAGKSVAAIQADVDALAKKAEEEK